MKRVFRRIAPQPSTARSLRSADIDRHQQASSYHLTCTALLHFGIDHVAGQQIGWLITGIETGVSGDSVIPGAVVKLP